MDHSKPALQNTLYRMPKKLQTSLEIIKKDKEYRELYGGEKQTFSWLMHHLLPYSEKIKGCELIFPDTVFFEDGKPKVIIKTEKDYCLISQKGPVKLSLVNILKDF